MENVIDPKGCRVINGVPTVYVGSFYTDHAPKAAYCTTCVAGHHIRQLTEKTFVCSSESHTQLILYTMLSWRPGVGYVVYVVRNETHVNGESVWDCGHVVLCTVPSPLEYPDVREDILEYALTQALKVLTPRNAALGAYFSATHVAEICELFIPVILAHSFFKLR